MSGHRLKWGDREVVFRASPFKNFEGELCSAALSPEWESYIIVKYNKAQWPSSSSSPSYRAVLKNRGTPEIELRGPFASTDEEALNLLYRQCINLSIKLEASESIAATFGPYALKLESVIGAAPREYKCALNKPPLTQITVVEQPSGWYVAWADATCSDDDFTIEVCTESPTIQSVLDSLWADISELAGFIERSV